MSLICNNQEINEAYRSINASQVIESAKKQPDTSDTGKHPSRCIMEAYKNLGKDVKPLEAFSGAEKLDESKVNEEVEADAKRFLFMVSEMAELDTEAKTFLEAISAKEFTDVTEAEKSTVIKIFTAINEEETKDLDGEQFIEYVESKMKKEEEEDKEDKDDKESDDKEDKEEKSDDKEDDKKDEEEEEEKKDDKDSDDSEDKEDDEEAKDEE